MEKKDKGGKIAYRVIVSGLAAAVVFFGMPGETETGMGQAAAEMLTRGGAAGRLSGSVLRFGADGAGAVEKCVRAVPNPGFLRKTEADAAFVGKQGHIRGYRQGGREG